MSVNGVAIVLVEGVTIVIVEGVAIVIVEESGHSDCGGE